MLRLSWIRRASLLLIAFLCCIIIRNVNFSRRVDDWTRLKGSVTTVTKSTDTECVKHMFCPKGEKMIVMRPESQTKPPLICMNNKRLFDATKFVKGLNIAILDSRKNEVSGLHYLNVQDSDYSVIKLLAQVQSYEIIVGTSYGDVSSKISAEARQLLRMFGFSLAQYKTESSILFIGQLGLSNSEAYEKVTALGVTEPEYYLRCLTTPLGKLSNVTVRVPEAHHIDELIVAQLAAVKGRKMDVKFGAELPNCGQSKSCQEDEIAMSFYSGKDKDDSPQLCVNGRFVIDRDLNSAGRGLNLVVIDSKTHQVMRTGHYDTYLEDSSALVLFLEQLSPGEILAVISFDEASNSLSDMAKHIFYELGSSLIRHLKFRASWYFIGQKGIDGYTPFEDMNLPSGNDWAKPINLAVCVPSVLDGLKTIDYRLSKAQNMLRRHFCSRYDGYEDFCDETQLDIPLVPRSGKTILPSTDPIYSIPILLAGGLSTNNIRLCLESIYNQEGINPQKVVVAFDSVYTEVADLSALFHVRAMPINDTASYNDFVLKGIDYMMTLFPSAPCLIVIEEDTVLLPGFLYFLGQLLPHFLKDTTANVVLTLNHNGIKSGRSDVSSVYRVDSGTAAAAFMLKKSFYEEHMKNREKCCRRTKYGWLIPGFSYMSAVSRAKIIRTFDLNAKVDNRTNSEESSKNTDILTGDEKISNVERLNEESYDADLRKIIADGKKFYIKDKKDVKDDCVKNAFRNGENNTATVTTSIIVYKENTDALENIAQCFNLPLMLNLPLGLYKGTVRFSSRHASFVLVASSSPLLGASSTKSRIVDSTV